MTIAMTAISEQMSFMGRRWSVLPADQDVVGALLACGETSLSARVMAARSICAQSHADFILPRIKESLPAPLSFLGMQAGAARIAQAITCREKIGIWSDYDVDGATSAAILGSFLRLCHHRDFEVRIPDRIEEGYGPNTPGLLQMHADGCGLIVILDSGTTAFEPLAAARAAGIDVVVIDHHAAQETLPEAVAVINPNRQDQPAGQGHICAAGMTFITTVAITAILRKAGWFDGQDLRPNAVPDIWSLLDLVALGTVCDVVPLIGINRAFVYRGLPLLSARKRAGIAALASVAGIAPENPITEKECGWVLGPRINAGGRIGQSRSGADLLLEDDPAKAMEKAEWLHQLNAERKTLDGQTTETAIAQLEGRQPGRDRSLALAVVEDAHEGVVGISAARLREAYDAPAIVLARAHDGTLKGSARSVPGFDIGHAIIAAREAGLLLKGGGHGMAGGLSVAEEALERFIAFMNAEIAKTDYARNGVMSEADAMLSLPELTVSSIEGLERLRPFGTANLEPRIILEKVTLREIHVLKETHFKLTLADGDRQIAGLIWGAAQQPVAEPIRAAQGRLVDVYGTASINTFRGNSQPQIIISDIRLHAGAREV